MNHMLQNTIVFTLLVVGLVIGGSFAGAQNTSDLQTNENNSSSESIQIPLSFESYSFVERDEGLIIQMDDFGRLPEEGKPFLPSKIVAVAVPPNAVVKEVLFSGEPVVLSGSYEIAPVPAALPLNGDTQLSRAQQQRFEQNYLEVYQSNDLYPSAVVELVRSAGFRRYDLVDVRVSPFQYRPVSQQLLFYPDLTVEIIYAFAQDSSTSDSEAMSARMEHRAEEFIVNYKEAQQWYPPSPIGTQGLYDYVIITTRDLIDAVQPIVEWETQKGRNVNVVTVESIGLTGTGPDLSAKMRSMLLQNYPIEEWGIEDVLLVGSYDDVPMRRVAQDLGYGQPETDFYYAELSRSDIESWDVDSDLRYGETYDDHIDFYTEVSVGRIPWSNPTTVQEICEKTVAFEQNSDPSFKKNILLLGAFFWDDDPNPRTDNAVLMEAKVDQSWMGDWTMTRMYEEGWSAYPMDYDINWQNVKDVWSTGKFAFVNWAGHGSPWSSHVYHTGEAFVSTDTCSYLNDEYPSIIFADACSNSDTDEVNIGQCMLRQGGVGFVGATKVALGRPAWDHPLDGSSQSLDYYFTTRTTSGDYTQGEALHLSLQDMYSKGLWSYDHYETFEWGSLWGSPSLGMANIDEFPIFEILDVSGGMKVKATIKNSGTADATDVESSIKITGGILDRINLEEHYTQPLLAIGDQVLIEIPITDFGLGPVEVIVTVETRVEKHIGFMIGPFILV